MFIEYAWNAGATPANVTADLAALVAGAAVASLSASCNKAQTAFYGEAGGWALHDAAYGVVKRRAVDDSCDKFVRLNFSASSAFQIEIMDAWDAAAHTATNSQNVGNLSTAGSLSSAGSVRMSVKPEFVLLINAGWADFHLAGEFERESILAQAGPSCACVMGGVGGGIRMLKKKAASAIGMVSGAAGSMLPAVLPSTPFRDATESNLVQMVRATLLDEAGFVMGRVRGVWMTGEKRSGGDTVTAGGKTYLHLPVSAGRSWFVEKG